MQRRAISAIPTPNNPLSRLLLGILPFLAASLIMALLVAMTALGLEHPSATGWRAGDTLASALEADAWCKTLNQRTICVGEPD